VSTERKRAKVLLVDDRPENLLVLEAILQGLDHDLVTAPSGEEALKRLLTDDFAVILLDVQMPGMDGFETAEHIKRRERTRHIPIVFLTAIDRKPHHAFRGYATGAVDYLAKPFDPWVLRAKVSVFIDLWEKNRCGHHGADERAGPRPPARPGGAGEVRGHRPGDGGTAAGGAARPRLHLRPCGAAVSGS
jgi:CheY-like chemotaxis protein